MTITDRLDDELTRRLMHQRIVVLGEALEEGNGNRLMHQLLLLSAEDKRADISLWINSPGGSVSAMLAIHDVMRLIPNDVSTLAMGMAASAGQFLLSAGTPGKRLALPHARILLHQGSAGIGGTAMDIEIQAKDLRHTRDTVLALVAEHTGQSVETIERDSRRDRWFRPRRRASTGSSTAWSPPSTTSRRPVAAPLVGLGRSPGWPDEHLHDPVRRPADAAGRAHRRPLLPAALGPDHLPRHRDRRRRRQRRDRPAAAPGLGGALDPDQPVHQLPRRLDHRDAGDLRRHAVRGLAGRDDLRRPGRLDGRRTAGRRRARPPPDAAARARRTAPAGHAAARHHPRPDRRGRRGRPGPRPARGDPGAAHRPHAPTRSATTPTATSSSPARPPSTTASPTRCSPRRCRLAA